MNTKQKILLIVPMLHQGGFERVCVLTARLLQPYYDITIVVFDLKDIAYDIEGLHVVSIDMGVKNGKLAKIVNMLKRSLAVKKIKKELHAKIAYSFGITANLVNIFSGRQTKIWCGIRSAMDLDNPGLMRLFSKRSDLIVCCSKVIEEQFRERFGCKAAVTLYNPYNMDEIRGNAKEPVTDFPWDNWDHIIVSMGREDDVKGFWHLIKSFYLVQKEIENAKLMIIGEGTFLEYKQLARELGIENKCFFTGVKTNPFAYLAKGQVYVMTSINEGFPNALVEAMILGLPVIATNCMTGPAEILDGDNGILIPCLSPIKNLNSDIITEEESNLASQIALIITDERRYQEYHIKSLRRCEHFDYNRYVKQWMQFYEM